MNLQTTGQRIPDWNKFVQKLLNNEAMSLFGMWKLWSTLQHAPNSTPKSQKQSRSGRQEVITYNTTDSLGRKPVTLNSLISDTQAFKPWLSWQRSQTSWVQTRRSKHHTGGFIRSYLKHTTKPSSGKYCMITRLIRKSVQVTHETLWFDVKFPKCRKSDITENSTSFIFSIANAVRVWTHTYQKLSCRSLTSDLQLETQIKAFVNADDNVMTRITGTPTILSPHPSSWALISHRGPSCSLRLDPGKPCSREQWRQCHWSLFKHSSWSHSW